MSNPASEARVSHAFLRAMILPALLVALWGVAYDAGWLNPKVFVSPLAVLRAAWTGFGDGSVPGAALATLARAMAGWVIGAGIGLVFGIALGISGVARGLFDPTVNSLRQIALFAWIPLLSAWLGNGETMKITLIALGAFFPMALGAQAGTQNVPIGWRELGAALELGPVERLRRIILPAALPAIVTGVELSLNVAWLGTFGAEYLIGTGYINGMGDGLGAYLAAAREYARMDQVLLGVLILGIIGVSLDRGVAHLSRKVAPWQTH
ncbi:ABC transporter permease [Paracoccus aminophilus]|uniref:ABC-type nitrate/sulfonate/bicarbonate transport system, permease component n=1 Tax=Paracoccus aminophilus JCM 7686 TaxID=1367847 RepID=S5Y723_PARAH|nr:ABC transporter permease [Paracoccus aminophilus]AGT11365.1 ABC-type nitrate/sulfonate/bicarbonate transport system, permease component [Paracoccus aminophilus JCM 7686]